MKTSRLFFRIFCCFFVFFFFSFNFQFVAMVFLFGGRTNGISELVIFNCVCSILVIAFTKSRIWFARIDNWTTANLFIWYYCSIHLNKFGHYRFSIMWNNTVEHLSSQFIVKLFRSFVSFFCFFPQSLPRTQIPESNDVQMEFMSKQITLHIHLLD